MEERGEKMRNEMNLCLTFFFLFQTQKKIGKK